MNNLAYILYLYIWDKSHQKPSEEGHTHHLKVAHTCTFSSMMWASFL